MKSYVEDTSRIRGRTMRYTDTMIEAYESMEEHMGRIEGEIARLHEDMHPNSCT